MADRTDWENATRAQRHLAVAADADLRRRHPGQRFPALRSAEPPPLTQAQHDDLTLAPAEPIPGISQRTKDLAAGYRAFTNRLADRQNTQVPSGDPDDGYLTGDASTTVIRKTLPAACMTVRVLP